MKRKDREQRELPGQSSFLGKVATVRTRAVKTPVAVPKQPKNSTECPQCAGSTRVRCTRPPFRYRYCQECGFSYRTQEVIQQHAEALISLVSTVIGGLNECGIKPASPDDR